MKQIKKLLFLLFAITSVNICQIEQIEISEVAEQKSVIEEQATPLAGISLSLYQNHLYTATLEVNNVIKVNSSDNVKYRGGWLKAATNIRLKPNLESKILSTFDYNTYVSYIPIDLTWSQIKYYKTIAYVETKYINSTINSSLSPYVNLINNLTEEEKYLIYQITYAESGNQDIYGQRAVIEVILNRILSDNFPNTVYEVLSQPGQFETWGLQNIVTHNEEQEIALQLVYENQPILGVDYLMFSLGQFSWANNYIKIEDMWFGTF